MISKYRRLVVLFLVISFVLAPIQPFFTILAATLPLSITTSSLPDGSYDRYYSQQLSGNQVVSWQNIGAQIPGISVYANGLVAGSPNVGKYILKVRAFNAARNNSIDKSFAINILPPPPRFHDVPEANQNGQYWNYIATGQPPLTFSISNGSLPKGLSMSDYSGMLVFQGVPTIAGKYKFILNVSDSFGQMLSKVFLFNVKPMPPKLTRPANPWMPHTFNPVQGALYSQAIPCNCSGSPYVWKLSRGSLPPGLTFNSATGTVSGTASTMGTFTTNISVTDEYGQSDTFSYNFEVIPPPLVISTSSSSGSVQQSAIDASASTYSQTLSATGGRLPYSWSLAGGALPNGFQLSSRGIISGKLTMYGEFSFTVKATDISGETAIQVMTLKVVPAKPYINTPGTSGLDKAINLNPLVVQSIADDYATSRFEAISSAPLFAIGAGPFTWLVVDGILPPGINIKPEGKISGIPTMAGTYTFTLKVTDSYGQSATRKVEQMIHPPFVKIAPSASDPQGDPSFAIVTPSLPDPVLNTQYDQTLLVSIY